MPRSASVLAALCLMLGAQQPPHPEPATPSSESAPVSTGALWTGPSSATLPTSPPLAKAPLIDDDLLDPAWFGLNMAFDQDKEVDYFWSRPGLDLTGRTLFLKTWEAPVMLHPDRDARDKARSVEVTGLFPGMLWGALSGVLYGKVTVSRTEGDLVLVGRFVDVGAESKKVRWLQIFGSGESATWDLKIVDTRTGELVLAVHHRVYTKGVRNNLQDRLQVWSGIFATRLAARTVK